MGAESSLEPTRGTWRAGCTEVGDGATGTRGRRAGAGRVYSPTGYRPDYTVYGISTIVPVKSHRVNGRKSHGPNPEPTVVLGGLFTVARSDCAAMGFDYDKFIRHCMQCLSLHST